ncbi:sensor histidine kinase [Thermanaerovibrio velox]|uniref:sensor histidine kinase n=1 Tax=Thermanaerovibrio velox TaxID=108007 RepID=UPI000594B0E8
MWVLGGEVWSDRIDDALDKAARSLDSSIETVLDIRDEIRSGIKEKQREIEEIRKELEDVIAASDSLAEAYRKARLKLAKAAENRDEAMQAEAYDEASRFMKLKGSFEERERGLRKRRDEAEREKARLERMLLRTDETMGKLKLALEVLKNNTQDLSSAKGERDYKAAAMSLRLVEQESLRLAREVHDGPAQHCSGALLIIDRMEGLLLNGDLDMAREEIRCLRDQMEDAVKDFRTFLWRLKPSGLDFGIKEGLERLAQTFSDRYSVHVEVLIRGDGDAMSGPARSNAYRIVQEAVANAIRHGGAKKVKILGSFGDSMATFKVSDDGRGFDPEAARLEAYRRGSLGLINMEERVRLLGGTIRIESAPGRGTSVIFSIPLGRLDDEKDSDCVGR